VKKITISVADDLYQRVHVRAVEKHSTVSALVRDFLTRLVEEESEFSRLGREQNEVIGRIGKTNAGFSANTRLTRDEVHRRRGGR
jgi:plasmid stability protein